VRKNALGRSWIDRRIGMFDHVTVTNIGRVYRWRRPRADEIAIISRLRIDLP
jgi:hypothetical protein